MPNKIIQMLGIIEVSAARSNLFWAKKPAVITSFKLQLVVIKKKVAAITPLADFDMRPQMRIACLINRI